MVGHSLIRSVEHSVSWAKQSDHTLDHTIDQCAEQFSREFRRGPPADKQTPTPRQGSCRTGKTPASLDQKPCVEGCSCSTKSLRSLSAASPWDSMDPQPRKAQHLPPLIFGPSRTTSTLQHTLDPSPRPRPTYAPRPPTTPLPAHSASQRLESRPQPPPNPASIPLQRQARPPPLQP